MIKPVYFSLSLIISMAFFCFSCNGTEEKPRLERIAKAYCDCMAASNLQELNDKAVSEAESLSNEESEQLFKALESEFNAVKECNSTVTATLGKATLSELDSLQKMLPNHCPPIAKDRQQMRELLGN